MTCFRQLHDAPTGAYTYLIADTDARAAVLIDPTAERMIVPLLALLAELDLRLAYVLCTHAHPGDATVADSIRARTDARVAAGARAPVAADLRLHHGDSLTFGNEVIHVLGTPGHTPGCVSYLWRDRVFTGDALLIRACGRTDLPDADAGALYDSITQRLMVLPGDTLVYPGHDTEGRTVSTIAEEREHNPCVAGRCRDEFITERLTG
jgi:glyoxylase-like metal-dependent hydrolase (beta-lactamase superfamily II)